MCTSLPSHLDLQLQSPSPSSVHLLAKGKLEHDELKELKWLDEGFYQLHAQIFEDGGFASLRVEEKCAILDNASSFTKKALAHLETLKLNAKHRTRRT